ncbi:MAG: Dienelactone hydrolase family protein [Verrucomicrobia bacterium]|nr:Dienelactone hydrolase family protein [Verrucomicrobiota bacterium]
MKAVLALVFSSAVALTASAKIVTRTVRYEHAGVKLSGYLAYDDTFTTQGKIPGVVIVHEWWGQNDYVRGRAEQLAKLGYAAFALDMYGAGESTSDPKRAGELAGQFYGKPLMAERAQAGLDQLLATGLVDPNRVAAIGYCFGGSTVQALAYSGAPLAGVVSFHGGLIPVPAEAAAKTKAKILVCNGGADGFVPSKDIDAFITSMNAGKFDYQFISYAGAVHAFTNPDADAMSAKSGLKGIGYNAAADRRSWQHMKDFFAEIFAVAPRP